MSGPRERLGDRVTNELQDMIFSEYKPGDKIPTEEILSKQFSVSRITVREAITNLKSKGILDVRQGDGTFVSKLTPSSFMKPILPMLKLKNTDIADIFEVRILIETKAAQLAATHGISKDELAKLNSLLKLLDQAAIDKNTILYNDLDLEFHQCIAHYSQNEVLSTIHELLLDLIKETIQKACSWPEHIISSIVFHKRIVQAISNQNPEKAGEMMCTHLTDGLAFIRKLQSGEIVEIDNQLIAVEL